MMIAGLWWWSCHYVCPSLVMMLLLCHSRVAVELTVIAGAMHVFGRVLDKQRDVWWGVKVWRCCYSQCASANMDNAVAASCIFID